MFGILLLFFCVFLFLIVVWLGLLVMIFFVLGVGVGVGVFMVGVFRRGILVGGGVLGDIFVLFVLFVIFCFVVVLFFKFWLVLIFFMVLFWDVLIIFREFCGEEVFFGVFFNVGFVGFILLIDVWFVVFRFWCGFFCVERGFWLVVFVVMVCVSFFWSWLFVWVFEEVLEGFVRNLYC